MISSYAISDRRLLIISVVPNKIRKVHVDCRSIYSHGQQLPNFYVKILSTILDPCINEINFIDVFHICDEIVGGWNRNVVKKIIPRILNNIVL